MATKYRKGKCINSLPELMTRLEAESWIFLEDKPLHPSFIINLPVKKLKAFITLGKLFEAVERNGHQEADSTFHRSPKSHKPLWLLDRSNFAVCQYPDCKETKQYPTVAEVDKEISRHRNYKVKR